MDPIEISEQETPAFDDGWWASVLAEEENRVEMSTDTTPKGDGVNQTPDWGRAKSLYQQDEIIEVKVNGFNRGGLLVDGEGLSGFVPCSHLVNLQFQPGEENREECLSLYLNRKIKVKIIECVPEESRMVFSERAARSEAGKRPMLFSTIQSGQKLTGDVTNVTEFGVFVDLGGVEGLIHISELSWGRVTHPSEVCKVGQSITVLVMEVTPERCRIALSIKRLHPNPWDCAQQKYPINIIVPAVVTALVPFGAFARIEEGLEGLIHATEIPVPPSKSIKDVLVSGQKVMVRVLQVEPVRQRLGLSMKFD